MLTDSTVRRFLDDAAADVPSPGGGSASALAGALGAAMASMAANFTLGRKRFADVADQVRCLLEVCERVRTELTDLIDADARAYEALCAARRLPADSSADKKKRDQATREAARKAAGVPLAAVRLCLELLCACRGLLPLVNPALVSDVGVAASLAAAALEGAALNVEVNLPSVGDPDYVASTRGDILQSLHEGRAIRDDLIAAVTEKVSRP